MIVYISDRQERLETEAVKARNRDKWGTPLTVANIETVSS